MNKERLFHWLREQDKESLLALLGTAYDLLGHDDRRMLFGDLAEEIPPTEVDGDSLLAEIEQFDAMSRAGHYYAPFSVNSQNFMDIPEETEEWFERLGDLLQDSCQLVAQQEYRRAVDCFRLLYALIDTMESGDEIVFADELGSWMIPNDEKEYLTAYIIAAAQTTTPEEFTEIVVPLAWRDSVNSLAGQVYATACRLASAEQRAVLDAEIQRRKIRTERRW